MHECIYRFSALGSDCELRLFAAEKAAAHEAGVTVSNEIARIEARCSRYRADSELSRIDAAGKAGASVEVDDETQCRFFGFKSRRDGFGSPCPSAAPLKAGGACALVNSRPRQQSKSRAKSASLLRWDSNRAA